MKKGYKPKGKLGSGSRFAAVSNGVESEYLKKGYSAERAKSIGGAVAAKVGRKKYGVSRMAKWAAAGKK